MVLRVIYGGTAQKIGEGSRVVRSLSQESCATKGTRGRAQDWYAAGTSACATGNRVTGKLTSAGLHGLAATGQERCVSAPRYASAYESG